MNKTKGLKEEDSMELSQIKTSSIFDIKMLSNNDNEKVKLEYSTEITQWETNFMNIKFDFDDPVSINKGKSEDKLVIIIKRPELFVS